MTAQSLIFCVGAAKAGTSWLHNYLRSHDECYLRSLKELHYFNALDRGGSKWHRKQMVKRLDEVQGKLSLQDGNQEQVQLAADLEAWLDVFDGETPVDRAYLDYVGLDREKAKIVGDFTPAYALLSKRMLAHMASFAKKVRVIFLMREPVDRLWSNIRMNVAWRGPQVLAHEVDSYLSGENRNLIQRSNYRRTLNRLLEVLPRDALHLEFYERLFTPEAIERLCGFLGIAPKPAAFLRVVHGGRKSTLDPEMRVQLQASLKPQYNYVDKLMGGLPSEWTNRMVSA